MMAAMIKGMPLRTLMMMGNLPRNVLESLLLMINGKIFKGLFGLVKARLGKN